MFRLPSFIFPSMSVGIHQNLPSLRDCLFRYCRISKKNGKTLKKRKIFSLRPIIFFFLHSLQKNNTLILSSRPEVLWTGVEGSAFLKAIPVADVPTSLDMTLGGRFADMNMKIKPSKFYFLYLRRTEPLHEDEGGVLHYA